MVCFENGYPWWYVISSQLSHGCVNVIEGRAPLRGALLIWGRKRVGSTCRSSVDANPFYWVVDSLIPWLLAMGNSFARVRCSPFLSWGRFCQVSRVPQMSLVQVPNNQLFSVLPGMGSQPQCEIHSIGFAALQWGALSPLIDGNTFHWWRNSPLLVKSNPVFCWLDLYNVSFSFGKKNPDFEVLWWVKSCSIHVFLRSAISFPLGWSGMSSWNSPGELLKHTDLILVLWGTANMVKTWSKLYQHQESCEFHQKSPDAKALVFVLRRWSWILEQSWQTMML